MKKIGILIALLWTSSILAQRPSADKVKAGKDSLTIQPILHASIILEWNKRVIYIDPSGGAKAYEGMPAPDVIIITDIHGDHADIETLKALQTKSNTTYVMPYAVSELIPKDLAKN